MRPIRFGVQVSELPFRGWAQRVRWYEDLGFTTISSPDHYTMRQWDPVVLQAVAASATRTAAVGSTVLNVGLREPLDLARESAVLAGVAAGGCELGLGAGWMPDDFVVAGKPYDTPRHRLERLHETVVAIRSLWTQDTTDFEGVYFHLEGAPSVLSLPLPRMPKLLMGGTMPKALGMAGRHADIVSVFPSVASGKIGWPGWALGSTREHTAQQAQWALAGAEAAGRSRDDIELSTQVTFTAVGTDPSHAQKTVADLTGVNPQAQAASTIFVSGTPAEARDQILRCRDETGLSYFVIFDLAYNYANPGGKLPVRAGDGGPGANDRYFEAFAEYVVKPLTGQ